MKNYPTVKFSSTARLLTLFTIGIILSNYFYAQFIFVLNYLLIATGVFILICLILSNTKQFKKLHNLSICCTFIFLGCSLTLHHLQTPDLKQINGLYHGTVYDIPEEKENTFLIPVKLSNKNISNSTFKPSCKVQLYIKKTPNRTDSIKIGDLICFKGYLKKISNLNNPHEFDYVRFMARKNVYYQAFLIENDFIFKPNEGFRFQSMLSKLRSKSTEVIHSNLNAGNSQAIVSALTLGEKHFLSDELKQSFANAGAMHVLAVSGLHIGIIYGFLNVILSFITSGRLTLFRILFSITIIWSYAALTGFSASVCRAALMFTFISIAHHSYRTISYYSLLATTALLLLLFNPMMLFDVGFQLSFLAVGGIFYFQPLLYQLFTIKNTVLDWGYKLICVSIAAQLSTAPLTLYYFNQFPIYFWLTNILLIPLILVVMVSSILLFAFSWQIWLAKIIGAILDVTLHITQLWIQFVENLPASVINNIFVSRLTVVVLFAGIFTLTLWLKDKKVWYLKLFLSSAIILLVIRIPKQESPPKLLFYNTPKSSYLSINHNGKTDLLYSNNNYKHTKLKKNYLDRHLQQHLKNRVINYISIDSLLDFKKKSEYSCFRVKIPFQSSILIIHNNSKDIPEGLTSDFTFISGTAWPPKSVINSGVIILGNKLYPKQQKAWYTYALKHDIEVINLVKNGAYSVYNNP